ncbi:hypothetical protein EVAR_62577_1 [Eumeta japonica]|uniref:Uncharacterized protein n=1 Tax=Eumeta variegata TaxID=151549 RepID=A0A4C1YM50_EUMVA|nr:hypothetical protein EVAR_62577_1 [Eumeta japonica]
MVMYSRNGTLHQKTCHSPNFELTHLHVIGARRRAGEGAGEAPLASPGALPSEGSRYDVKQRSREHAFHPGAADGRGLGRGTKGARDVPNHGYSEPRQARSRRPELTPSFGCGRAHAPLYTALRTARHINGKKYSVPLTAGRVARPNSLTLALEK